MPVFQYVRLDVFTDQAFTGIQLAVFLDAAGIDERRTQRIANEMALPETSFVLPPEAPGTDARVRIFTPSQELPMAGSPTIGTTFALAGAGRLPAGADKAVLGLNIGPIAVGLEWGPSGLRFAWMKQPLPTLGPVVADTVAVAAALGVQPSDVAGGGRFLWPRVCIRSAKIARGGRCRIPRSCEAVRATPRGEPRRAPCFHILARAGRRWRHGLQSNVRARLRHSGGSGHRQCQWTAGRISAQVQRCVGQDRVAAREPPRRPHGPPKSYSHCAL